jgi:hypothetical protein
VCVCVGGGGTTVNGQPANMDPLKLSRCCRPACAARSCLKYFSTAADWAGANASCSAVSAGYHLLTSRQVGRAVLDCVEAGHGWRLC